MDAKLFACVLPFHECLLQCATEEVKNWLWLACFYLSMATLLEICRLFIKLYVMQILQYVFICQYEVNWIIKQNHVILTSFVKKSICESPLIHEHLKGISSRAYKSSYPPFEFLLYPQAYLRHFQTSMMELFAKTVNGYSQLSIFSKQTPSEILHRVLNMPLISIWTAKHINRKQGFWKLIIQLRFRNDK